MAPQGPRNQNPAEGFSDPNANVGWPKKFLSFSITMFVLVFLTYFGLSFGYQTFLNSKIETVRAELDVLESQVTPEQKESLATLYSQVTNIRDLIKNHSLASKFFDSLEVITSENVSYLEFDMDIPNKEVAITGVAASYEDLVSQLALYEESPEIETITLEKASLDGSIVDFSLKMIVSEESFKSIR
jgi:hypothetical protein